MILNLYSSPLTCTHACMHLLLQENKNTKPLPLLSSSYIIPHLSISKSTLPSTIHLLSSFLFFPSSLTPLSYSLPSPFFLSKVEIVEPCKHILQNMLIQYFHFSAEIKEKIHWLKSFSLSRCIVCGLTLNFVGSLLKAWVGK